VILTSPTLPRFGRSFRCNVVNAGTKPAVVDVEVVESDGTVFGPTLPPTIQPGTSSGFGVSGAIGSEFLFCRFTIIEGSKKGLRANACVLEAGAGSSACTASADAR
jgi:hypothetical protein